MKMNIATHDDHGQPISGPVQVHFKNGQVAVSGLLLNGEKNGDWVFYLLNGQIKAKGRFDHGKMDGPWVWYLGFVRAQRDFSMARKWARAG